MTGGQPQEPGRDGSAKLKGFQAVTPAGLGLLVLGRTALPLTPRRPLLKLHPAVRGIR
ncbi:hypothetical protein [Streptomyces avidinii]